jgi:hypothetical protein
VVVQTAISDPDLSWTAVWGQVRLLMELCCRVDDLTVARAIQIFLPSGQE